jgi:Fur family ferric uptake transcriptional regulator
MSLREISRFRDYLKDQGFKWTPEREKVLKEALILEGHFEADELVYRLRRKGIRVSKATVYRTLPLLVKAGFIKEVIHGEKHLHYEHVHGNSRHDHLICLGCGKIIEFEDGAMRELEERICRERKFRPEKVLFEIYGYCEGCK